MENDNEETFSTTEGSTILKTEPQTFRSWLHRAPKLFPQTERGSWRRLTKDNLLAIRIMQVLMAKGIELEDAADVVADAYFIKDLPKGYVQGARVSMSDDSVALVLDFDPTEKIIEKRLLSVAGCQKHVSTNLFNAGTVSQTFINIVQIKCELQERIWAFQKAEKE